MRRRAAWLGCVAIAMAAALLLLAPAVYAQSFGEGSWSPTGSMATPRAGHTATLLDGPACDARARPAWCGKVLVAGGTTDDPAFPEVAVDSAELYDPRTGRWSPTGSLNTARSNHTATLLTNGKVLVVGGRGGDDVSNPVPLSSAELYDPASGTWTSCSAPATPSASCPGAMTGELGRYDHTATLLRDGRVLVVGGPDAFSGPGPPPEPGEPPPPPRTDPSAELYNPATGTWQETGELMQPRSHHSATLLRDGKVLVTGGTLPADFGGPEPTETKFSSELYNPATGAWSSCYPTPPTPPRPDCPGDLGQSRGAHTATLLPNAKVLAAGGQSNDAIRATAELYEPITGSWTPTKLLNQRRSGPGTALLPSGKVLVAGGSGLGFSSALNTAEVYDPVAPGSRWTFAGFMTAARGSQFGQPRSVQAVLLSSDAGSYRADPAVCGGNCGKVLVVGGFDQDLQRRISSAELYTPQAVPTRPGTIPGFPGCPTARVERNTIVLSSGRDIRRGTPLGDLIFAGAGNDVVDGLAGDDCIDLAAGRDRGQGGRGNDLVVGGPGADRMAGASGRDRLLGGAGNDRLSASSGSDSVRGGSGRDRLLGGSGNDSLRGQSGGDRVAGSRGNDRIVGGTGGDRISGGSGRDRIDVRDRRRDRVNCGPGRDRVAADRIDSVARNCERVRRR